MIKRVPTGIAEFDDLIKGGFKKTSINLIAGKAGTGKTVFAMQFLYNGVTKFNENGLYITFEEKKKKTYKDMLEFGLKSRRNLSIWNTRLSRLKGFWLRVVA